MIAEGQPPGSDPATWRICAVIVTFHPDERFYGRVSQIARQVDGVVIVDNGSAPPTVSRLAEFASRANVRVIQNPANLGIATALNQGVEYALAHGYTHAILFDQDTDPAEHMVSTIRQIASRRADIQRVAVIGVNLVDAATSKPWYRFPAGQEATEVKTVITSGSLISLQAAKKLGRFRDDFFIDHVDEEYCLRAGSNGYKVLITHEPLATHALGAPKFLRILWRTFGTSNHSATRRYYMTRNHIILAKMYAFREPAWVIRTLYLRFKAFLLLLVLDDDRWSKLRLMSRGLRDGLAGRTGELSPNRRPDER